MSLVSRLIALHSAEFLIGPHNWNLSIGINSHEIPPISVLSVTTSDHKGIFLSSHEISIALKTFRMGFLPNFFFKSGWSDTEVISSLMWFFLQLDAFEDRLLLLLLSLVKAYSQDNISRSFSAVCNILLSVSKFGAVQFLVFRGMRLSPRATRLQWDDGCRAESSAHVPGLFHHCPYHHSGWADSGLCIAFPIGQMSEKLAKNHSVGCSIWAYLHALVTDLRRARIPFGKWNYFHVLTLLMSFLR